MAENAPAVEMRGIVKRFPGVLANDHVNLHVAAGEIHALLGENGAGKSTLMNILAGLYRADEGQILIHGRPVTFRSPRDAIAHGIGMVHQHFMLVESQTVAENIILGLDEPRFWLDMGGVARKIAQMAERYGLAVDPNAQIWQLSVGEQQRVEILKALYHGADILVLDEPTAVLTPQEADQLYETVRHLAAEGKAVIFISHKLSEVFERGPSRHRAARGPRRRLTRAERHHRCRAGAHDGGPRRGVQRGQDALPVWRYGPDHRKTRGIERQRGAHVEGRLAGDSSQRNPGHRGRRGQRPDASWRKS